MHVPLLFSILLGSLLAVSASGSDDRPLHIYLLIGQSNMAGRAEIEEVDEAVLEDVFLLTPQGTWVPAGNPLNRYSSIGKRLSMQQLGPGYTFASSLAAQTPDAKIGLVVNARGGTRIEEWAPGSEFYQEAVRRTREAEGDGELKGILWHQGEGNSKDPDYLDKVSTLIQGLRSEFDNQELPFIAGQVEGDRPVNLQIAKLSDAVPHTAWVSSGGLTTFDGTHFDSASQREFGRRYAAEMLRLQRHPEMVGTRVSLFDGETFAGWEGATGDYFRVEEGAIVCGLPDKRVPHNHYLATTRSFRNFELTLKFKLTGEERVNSGVQIRSWRIPGGDEITGYQADLGNPAWWGSIYDEFRRDRVMVQSDMETLSTVLRSEDWNDYTIRAEGKRIQLWINGLKTADFVEEEEGIADHGVIALQIHSMAAGEARFKDIVIEELP